MQSKRKVTPFISIRNITKSFGKTLVLNDISLDIAPSEFFCLLGGSGAGKSTLLRVLAGFDLPDDGKIIIDGQDMADFPPYKRPVNMMFQSYALFPHMNVEDNISYGLRQLELSRQDIDNRVKEMLKMVQMSDFAKRKPHQLSGGQSQRVALARALARKPKLLLLDEPLAALDKKLREQTEYELASIQEKLGTTFIVVTHDQEEAMNMATKIGVMNQGKIEQVGTPHEIYEFPQTRHVADFIGSLNMFEAKVDEDEKDYVRLNCPELGNDIYVGHGISCKKNQTMWFAIRPEKIVISGKKPQQKENFAAGIVDDIGYVGSLSHYFIKLKTGRIIRITRTNRDRHEEDCFDYQDNVYISWTPASGVVLNR